MLTINPKDVSVPVIHHYLQGAVAPRPIAFASTVDKDGNVNLSPFSFFNLFGTKPPTLIFSPNRRVRDATNKHTFENVQEVDEVVINMVDYAMVEQMSLASCEYPKGTNEFVKAGFTEVPSQLVKPPRVGESKAVFECKVKQIISLGEEGGAANLIICEVILAHFAEDILDENGRIDQRKTDWVARMGGDWYARASGDALFEIPKPSTQRGIGVDSIPDFIKTNPLFTGNELGRLGNIEKLPQDEEIERFKNENLEKDFIQLAKKMLFEGKVKDAWLALLAMQT
ncbi:flavin reductase family protein [Runella salmonicolor]|uniref:Flavin reductase family protein n=1 Tax=Runella salmonicolor TaxID=2950278 RepID=A0ABT1FLP3_9BACT|nr:flavin reductase family protein [Runella salmonicolor]MCP1381468.1 flavin reductase family protein [Runella salmonicolor]